ncbi:MAG: Glutamate-tRNA ligase [Candidatus Nomurabacteria bacterium GW2011_GWE1_32_28]|uniref:Glutamate--tRNA ligase n=1 Tax=Candidatus Nomurabacteria bacterium GW2011_GWF1_31_48 TaxID=1618767 RepID=A0A0G0BHN8_9BACT|nr:MAG: Glutamate-tRNA ligase [Candidatus Nomurabacteria bacterium GW2011_GWF2_30_133]KKP29023.1 MAG: Glutamate-tRNA ligase [Candidatus Nomurabacteria bacterium GW2011_GWE2_31_40]KKP30567.1 MAG: Glutamate-tRNA ligase [Candidatus Nomurabacteria bacterium GW2011_GWF1_31_48]KKP35052.1 MAG: Glutamate-tRNA ligase [Candidatus Nomurabacteria bacterium GW2011_GWE1_32_28]HAS80583.1 glutamate--tRNA ligase [Candidatus Nomurabacteria bacterium]
MSEKEQVENKNKVVTRFAPSPTGFMHVGGIRTALYAWLWAKKNNGTFILRIEDTDKEREVRGSIEHIIESLNWLGINWHEGPNIGGPHASYLQSERLDLYKKYAQILINKGLAYPDPYTEEEVGVFRDTAELAKKPFLYREHRPEVFDKWDGAKPLRFKTPEIKSYKWNDLVYGNLSAGPEALDDFILIKSDGYPTYNFAHIVDDIEMCVTHVMRGQEFISSTPKFLSIYEALGIKPPFYATLPPIMGSDGKKKLGKRDGAKDVLEYRNEGYLPEAMINFLALLGWNPGDEREIFTVDELIEAFDISRIGHSGAQMNLEKLDWINKEHIKKLSKEELRNNIFKYLPDEIKIEKIIPIISERISKWSDITEMIKRGELDFFYKEPIYSKEKLIYKDSTQEEISNNIKNIILKLDEIDENSFSKEKVKECLNLVSQETGKSGAILHPVRFALSGLDRSPDPFIIAEILGKNETLLRLQKAL